MRRQRWAGTNWQLDESDDGKGVINSAEASLSVLMDLRDELQRLNGVFACSNFQAIPEILRQIRGHVERKPQRITTRQAARVLAKRRNRRKP